MVNRTRIEVRNKGTDRDPIFIAQWNGVEVEARNPFGLDSKLSDIGAPYYRDLYLVED